MFQLGVFQKDSRSRVRRELEFKIVSISKQGHLVRTVLSPNECYYFLKFCKKKKVKLINTYVRKNNTKQINVFKKLGMKKKGEHFYFEKRLK